MTAPGDRIDEYLRALRARLRTGPERTERILAEAEDHLRESAAAAAAAAGLSPDAAQKAAISSFGSVRTVARAHSARHRRFAMRLRGLRRRRVMRRRRRRFEQSATGRSALRQRRRRFEPSSARRRALLQRRKRLSARRRRVLRAMRFPAMITLPGGRHLERRVYLFWRVRLPVWVVLALAGWFVLGLAGVALGLAVAIVAETAFSYRPPRGSWPRRWRRGRGPGDLAGVREPRRPKPTGGAGAVQLPADRPTPWVG